MCIIRRIVLCVFTQLLREVYFANLARTSAVQEVTPEEEAETYGTVKQRHLTTYFYLLCNKILQ